MSWNEILETQQVQKDADGKRRGIRVFRVWNYSRIQILSDPTAIINDANQPLPGYNAPWEGMKLDSYAVTAVGPYFDATAYYSNDRRFQFPSGPPTFSSKSWFGSFQTESIDIPFAFRVSSTFTSLVLGGDPLVQTVSGWEFGNQPVDHKFERIGQTVVLDSNNIQVALEAIAIQADKIHKIRGRYYLFEPGDYTESTDGKWRVQYQWTRDPGTPSEPYVNDPWVFQPTDANAHFEYPSGSGVFYSRPPWHKLVMVRVDPNPSEYPQYRIVRTKDHSDLTGWVTLPGFTP